MARADRFKTDLIGSNILNRGDGQQTEKQKTRKSFEQPLVSTKEQFLPGEQAGIARFKRTGIAPAFPGVPKTVLRDTGVRFEAKTGIERFGIPPQLLGGAPIPEQIIPARTEAFVGPTQPPAADRAPGRPSLAEEIAVQAPGREQGLSFEDRLRRGAGKLTRAERLEANVREREAERRQTGGAISRVRGFKTDPFNRRIVSTAGLNPDIVRGGFQGFAGLAGIMLDRADIRATQAAGQQERKFGLEERKTGLAEKRLGFDVRTEAKKLDLSERRVSAIEKGIASDDINKRIKAKTEFFGKAKGAARAKIRTSLFEELELKIGSLTLEEKKVVREEKIERAFGNIDILGRTLERLGGFGTGEESAIIKRLLSSIGSDVSALRATENIERQ